MRYTVAALALAGAAMAGEGYYTKSDDAVYPDPPYSTKDAEPVDPPYPTYTNDWPTDYPTDYPHDYPTQSDDPAYPYPTYDPYTTYDPYPTYPVSTKKDDAYPTTTCTDDYVYPTYPVSTKYDHDYYTTSTIYTTKTYYVTKGHDVETKTDTYPVTTTVYPVKNKYPEKEYPEKEDVDTYKVKPTYPASKYPEKETKKYEPTAPACPTYSVKTIHTSITTVVPTVIYETVSVPCSTYKPIPTGSYPNATYPKYPVTAGASSFAVSGLAAAVVGLAAAALL
jgi:hypothetical protein